MKLYDGLAFKNTSGSAIQAGAAMEITGSVAEAGEIILTVKQPTTSGIDKKIIIWNGPMDIANNSGGRAQFGPLVLAVSSGSPALGTQVGPSDASWVVSSSGTGWVCLGPDPTASFPNGIVMLALGGSGGGSEYVYEITGSFVAGTPSTAKVTIYDKADESTVIATNQDWIGNLAMFDDHVVGSKGLCTKVGNVYVAQNAPCDLTGAVASAPVSIGTTPPVNTSSLWIDTSGL